MSLFPASPPGPPFRKAPLVGSGALPLSIAAIVGGSVSVVGDVLVEDGATNKAGCRRCGVGWLLEL